MRFLCSTPFGIIGRLTNADRFIVISNPVLNAFRHHRKTHCSFARSENNGRSCAQRLSASSEDSQIIRVCDQFGEPACSTPFGIIGRLTAVVPSNTRVLALSAQRLSASSEDSPPEGRSRQPSVGPCAQRLSASSEDSLYSHLFLERANNKVLNAFRHHRKTHQRNLSTEAKPIFECSTPFGIIGRLTFSSRSIHAKQSAVLNAFRHHRKTHATFRPLLNRYRNVLNAFRHHRKTHL